MLSGVRVVSFTHFLQGPSTSQLLADLGADVVKIESMSGAFERGWSAPDAYLNDTSVFFLLANRGVDSLSIDLKAPEARQILNDLLAGADVLVENFRPGAMERLGLGYEDVKALNPGIIYASLTGYGSDGPYRDRPGQDVLIQAMSGLAAATGRADQPPTPVGASLVDQHAAVLGAMGILAALHGREHTGHGMRVESNLLNAALDLQIEPLSYHLNGFEGERSGSGISSSFYKAPYGVFETSDGHLCLSLTALEALQRTFEDPWFAGISDVHSYARREDVNDRVAKHMRERTCAEWTEVFERERVWFAPVNGYADVVRNPQVIHNESFVTIAHPDAGEVRLLAHPIKYDGQRPPVRSVPPRLGEQTRSVLESLGYDEDRIANAIAAKVVRDDGR